MNRPTERLSPLAKQGLAEDFRPGMSVVRIEKAKLIEKLTENRSKHIEEYEEAVEGWKSKLIERVSEVYTNVIEDRQFDSDVGIYLPKPTSYEKDYNVALQKLEFSVDDTFELLDGEFRCFIMDEWQWKQSFTATNASYSSGR